MTHAAIAATVATRRVNFVKGHTNYPK